jgi:Icc-related predicted phosphoesterase
MKILIFSDIHNDTAALKRLMETEADCYIAAGDLVTFARGFEKVGPILQTQAGKVHVLPGNHESEADIDRFCAEYGLRPFHGRSFEAGGFQVAGLGYSNPTPFDTPGEYTETELAARLLPFANLNPLVLICHCPPKNTPLDEAGPGQHFGSTAVADFLNQHRPRFFACGHIHEAAGRVVNLGPTRAVNTGKQGYLLDLGKMQ